jgi:hypothetical protein
MVDASGEVDGNHDPKTDLSATAENTFGDQIDIF